MKQKLKKSSLIVAVCLAVQLLPMQACASETQETLSAATEIAYVSTAATEPANAVPPATEPQETAAETVPETTPETVPETIPETTEAITGTEDPDYIGTEETQAQEEPEQEEEKSIAEKAAEALAAGEMPQYFQSDYPDTIYAGGTIASNGCSITSLAMVASYLTGHVYTPDQLADWFGGYTGSQIERLEYASDELQLPWRKAENWHDARQALWDGEVVIALMNSNSIFTDEQHFIVIYGVTEDGKFLVRDSAKSNYSKWNLEQAYEVGFDDGDISCGFSGAWIYSKSEMGEDPYIYEEPEVESVECRYPGVTLSDSDKYLLACMIWVEAQGEPDDGQQAIAEVVLNRLVSDKFQDTVRGVITAEGQFRSTQFLDDAKPTQTQYEAIERALNGPYVLPIDVVYFATYKVNSNVWGTIGGHIFCYDYDYTGEE